MENEFDSAELLLPRLYERDIDVILQEEILFNDRVRDLFRTALKVADALTARRCELSVVDSTGETDVMATFDVKGRTISLLIENKIDAQFQPNQPERYKQRAAQIVAGGRSADAFCVLVAPQNYVHTKKEELAHFDATVSYETIAHAIQEDGSSRAKHRANLILRAIEQARSALAPVAEVGAFWSRIYQIASEEFPALQMEQPGEKGAGSHWVLFKADLPPRITIDWKIKQATVDLSFWKNSVHRPKPDFSLSELNRKASIVQLNDTTAIRVSVPRPPPEWTSISDDAIRDGLRAALDLYLFYSANLARFV